MQKGRRILLVVLLVASLGLLFSVSRYVTNEIRSASGQDSAPKHVNLNYGAVVNDKLPSESESDIAQTVAFTIIRYYPAKRPKEFTLIIVNIDEEFFNEESLRKLANQFSRKFQSETRIKIALTDDANILKKFSPVGAHYADFERALRGLYHLDRVSKKEFIELFEDTVRSRKKIIIELDDNEKSEE